MELKDKQKFFALYYRLENCVGRNGFIDRDNLNPYLIDEHDYLKLKNLSEISDDHIKGVFYMAHGFKGPLDVNIRRTETGIHCTHLSKVIDLEYHICLNFGYCTINSNLHFKESGDDKAESFKSNIGEIQTTSRIVVGWIQILDYLREMGYATPYKNLHISDLVKLGWVKI
jgi:hypothetical protein